MKPQKETKTCKRCDMSIDTSKDHYVELNENNNGKTLNTTLWHVKCYVDLLSSKHEQKVALEKATAMLSKIGMVN